MTDDIRHTLCLTKTKRYSTTLWLFYLPDFYFANQRSRQCNSSTYGQNNIVLVCIQNMVRIVLVYGTRCTSYVHIIRYRSRIQCQACIIVYIGGTIKRGNKKMAYFAWHHLRGQIVARHLFLLDFPILGTQWANFSLHTRGTPIFFGTMLLIRL